VLSLQCTCNSTRCCSRADLCRLSSHTITGSGCAPRVLLNVRRQVGYGPAWLLLLHLITHWPLLTNLLLRMDVPDTHLLLTQASSIPAASLAAADISSHLSASQLQRRDHRLLQMMAMRRLLCRTPVMRSLPLPARQQAAAASMAVQQMAPASSSNQQTVPSWPCRFWLHRACRMSTGSILN
jgi:hypothetical protein